MLEVNNLECLTAYLYPSKQNGLRKYNELGSANS